MTDEEQPYFRHRIIDAEEAAKQREWDAANRATADLKARLDQLGGSL